METKKQTTNKQTNTHTFEKQFPNFINQINN